LDKVLVSIKTTQCVAKNAVHLHLRNDASYPVTHMIF